MSRRRFEYILALKDFEAPVANDPQAGLSWRNPAGTDKQLLADLMLASYRGTIDYDDETIEDALKEVESWYSSISDQPWHRYSWLALMENELTCACLIDFWQERNAPLIAYVMTDPRWKGKHLATAALLRSLQTLADDQYSQVRAVITEGNLPSEKIFTRAGFIKRLEPD